MIRVDAIRQRFEIYYAAIPLSPRLRQKVNLGTAISAGENSDAQRDVQTTELDIRNVVVQHENRHY